ncbi:SDR family oxidoreductase [Cellulomonas sp. URHD0024]|uniref:SDR family oxidoreductase n=1 Tax=Cellulomonas sp. URHD0024 TaxID=1302620 RepID=UPI0004255299|nr:NAD(P)H-binding protein [Cellulomonas sp. URHD0024]
MADDDRPVLVTGGTGTLGRALVHTLLDAGRPVRVLSRRDRTPAVPDEVQWQVGDLLTGEGLPQALAGVSVVIHCASNPRKPDEDLDAAVQLMLACRAANVPHLVYISIVGVDAVPFGYYQVKRRVEEIVEDGGIPWSILRATQFHDFVATLLGALAKGPVALVPRGLRDQPVDVREVAARLATLAASGPAGRVEDLGGPQVLTVDELMRTYLAAKGRHARVWSFPALGPLKRFRDGGHLAPEHATGRLTFAEWLQH